MKKLNVAFIGCGIQARTGLVPQFLDQKNVVVRVACDVDKSRREAIAKMVNDKYTERGLPQLAKCRTEADFRKVVADPKIDAVCIATPDHWHAYISVEAMKAGKDVYCEKPLTYSPEESMKVMKAQKKYKRVFQTGAMQRSWREFRTAVMVVRNGFIGDIKYVDCNYGNTAAQNNTDLANFHANLGGPSHPHRFFSQWNGALKKNQTPAEESAPNRDIDWDMWLGPAPWSPYSDQCAPRGVHTFWPMFWRFDDNYATGYNGDWGAHHLDIAQWGLDMDKSGPVKVIRSEEPHSVNPYHGGRRQFGMKFVFADGCVLNHNPFDVWGTVFYGTKGVVAVNRGKLAVWTGKGVEPTAETRKAIAAGAAKVGGLKLLAASVGKDYGTDTFQKKDEALANAVEEIVKAFDLDHAPVQVYKSPNQVQNFVECCFSREPTISPAETGGRAAILCQLCNLSYMYDTGFDWDPAKCTFANGTGNPGWLKRPVYRNGWDIKV